MISYSCTSNLYLILHKNVRYYQKIISYPYLWFSSGICYLSSYLWSPCRTAWVYRYECRRNISHGSGCSIRRSRLWSLSYLSPVSEKNLPYSWYWSHLLWTIRYVEWYGYTCLCIRYHEILWSTDRLVLSDRCLK